MTETGQVGRGDGAGEWPTSHYCFEVEKAALTGLMDRAERRGLARRSSARALQVPRPAKTTERHPPFTPR